MEEINQFDPDGPGVKGALFGLPYKPEESEIIVVKVPWEATVSYRDGTAKGPQAVIDASAQVDLNHHAVKNAWMLKAAAVELKSLADLKHDELRTLAKRHIDELELRGRSEISIDEVNRASSRLNELVYRQAIDILDQNKIPVLLGGDHSTPLGQIKAVSERYPDLGLLQVDAHADLRESYEGFTYSHASIMYNVLRETKVGNLVQVGIRDFSQGEATMIADDPRIHCFFDGDIKRRFFAGENWSVICDEVIKKLPDHVYLSFDIDGLAPQFCPNTGTPVPGGQSYDEIIFLLEKLVRSGRKIVGLDLVEVAPGPDEWDANVGSRVLFNMLLFAAASNGQLPLR